ncbi:glycosyltransferase [Mariniflexile sp. HMF6888]|uniref:glycosyltransferase n=1 Tax=Mariniflexile sp. HMF6888 TaxID=3373086 RepID=UPI0037ACA975
MKQPILSIVIPVYNVDAYIDKCIHSCFDQNVSKNLYEIILVNDGSTDNSLELCEKLKLQYPYIKIISQKNKGLSGARNTGLKHSLGDYVWFVDSDDWIKTNCLPDILKKLNSDVDIIWLGHDVWSLGQSTKVYIPSEILNPISGEDFFINHLKNQFYIWKFIYKRGFLLTNDLTFFEGILYEDLEFTPRALMHAKKCITIPQVCYHYLVREGSIANNIKEKNIDHRFIILNKLANLIESDTVSKPYKSAITKVILHTITGTVNMAARANIKIPESGFIIINRLKKDTIFKSNLSLTTKIIKTVPIGYYNVFKYTYKLYKILPIKK